jgi:LacI family transcriptional regulator
MPNLTKSETAARVTIADVAKLAGVSTATVSRYLNQTAPVTEETAKQVQAAIIELGYVPFQAARTLASRRTNTLGLLLPDISSDFFPPMLRGIESASREHGFGLLISTQSGIGARVGGYHALGEHNSDGMLIFTGSLDQDELTRLHGLGFPMVLLYQSPPQGIEIPSIAFENKAGARGLMDHLIEVHHCRRIAFLRGPEKNEDSQWREQGYRESLEAHELPIDPRLLGRGGFSERGGYQMVQQWLNEGIEFDAVFAGDDRTASGVLAGLHDAGVQSPAEVAVVGFDDIPTARYFTPPLTTVHAPIERGGYEAAQQLVKLIREGVAERLVLLPTELVIRQSCGCP